MSNQVNFSNHFKRPQSNIAIQCYINFVKIVTISFVKNYWFNLLVLKTNEHMANFLKLDSPADILQVDQMWLLKTMLRMGLSSLNDVKSENFQLFQSSTVNVFVCVSWRYMYCSLRNKSVTTIRTIVYSSSDRLRSEL